MGPTRWGGKFRRVLFQCPSMSSNVLPMNTRRTATAADLTVGAIVYKGNGRTAYRVAAVVTEGKQHPNMGPYWTGPGALVVKVETKRVPTYGAFLRPEKFTVEA